jgi:hypothetical protein
MSSNRRRNSRQPPLSQYDFEQTLLDKVCRSKKGCWEWTGYKNACGYGQVGWNGRVHLAHRIFYSLFCCQIPAGMMACHSCDNPACCRPDHLFLGTGKDNQSDSVRKGRHQNGFTKGTTSTLVYSGERNSAAKLTVKGVLDIRQDHAEGLSLAAIARKRNASVSQVWRVVHRKNWGHVDGPN